MLKAAQLTRVTVKPEDLPVAADGPGFLLVGSVTALGTQRLPVMMVQNTHVWSLSQVPGTGLLRNLWNLRCDERF